jgi:hypothetical protein
VSSLSIKLLPLLKSGFQQEIFTIDNATGELKYKKEQTQVSVHKVTIIATDVAGNETEQLITVSVKSAILNDISSIGVITQHKTITFTINEINATINGILPSFACF